MSALSDWFENGLIDWALRGQAAPTLPANLHFALFRATAGQSPRSTAVTVGQTTIPATPNGRMYRCTTAGTTGAGEPTWGVVDGGTTADGGAVWTEMTADIEANAATFIAAEVSGGAYARVSVARSLANFAGTQGAGTTVASSGTGGVTSNNNAITFPAPTGADWGRIVYWGLYDASSAGNLVLKGALTTPKTVNNLDAAPSIAAAQWSMTWA